MATERSVPGEEIAMLIQGLGRIPAPSKPFLFCDKGLRERGSEREWGKGS